MFRIKEEMAKDLKSLEISSSSVIPSRSVETSTTWYLRKSLGITSKKNIGLNDRK